MSDLKNLPQIISRLRDPDLGCSWDAQQNFSSIAPYTIEEAYEVADAIARDDMDGLRDELGDLLFQVVFHAQMAEEAGAFAFSDVAQTICEKMVRRHPHVFGSESERRVGPHKGAWERIKATERAASGCREMASVLDGIAIALPALKRAQKLGKRAASVGFDWPDSEGARRKIDEEMAELSAAECNGKQNDIEEELGDLLFSVVNFARHLKVDPEEALSAANRKFEARFRRMESKARDQQADFMTLDLVQLENLWKEAKKST